MKHCSSQKEELMPKVGIDLTCLRTVNKDRMAGAQRLGGKGIFWLEADRHRIMKDSSKIRVLLLSYG